MFKEFTKDCYPKGEPIIILYPDNTYTWVTHYDFDLSHFLYGNGEVKMNKTESSPEYYPKNCKWCYEEDIVKEYLKEHGYKFEWEE